MKARTLSNEGTFISRIEKNIKNGWIYPNAIIEQRYPGGRYGNIGYFSIIENGVINGIGSIPDWHGVKNSKYNYLIEKIQAFMNRGLKRYHIQDFIGQRK